MGASFFCQRQQFLSFFFFFVNFAFRTLTRALFFPRLAVSLRKSILKAFVASEHWCLCCLMKGWEVVGFLPHQSGFVLNYPFSSRWAFGLSLESGAAWPPSCALAPYRLLFQSKNVLEVIAHMTEWYFVIAVVPRVLFTLIALVVICGPTLIGTCFGAAGEVLSLRRGQSYNVYNITKCS